MNIRRLRYFLQIADEGSMGRAANVLCIAQPALSRQMRLLESELGVPLFLRSRRGVELTEDGEQLRAALRKPISEIELALRNLRVPSMPIEEAVVLGMPSSSATILAIPLLMRLKTAYPKVKFSIIDNQSGQLIDGLLRGDIDLAVVHGPLPDERLFDRNVLNEDLVLVGGKYSSLAADKPIEFASLAQCPLILPRYAHHGVRAIVEKAAQRMDMALNLAFEVDSLQLTKELIESSSSFFTIMPLSAFAREYTLGQLKYAPVIKPALSQTLVFAVRQHLVLPKSFVRALGVLIAEEILRLVNAKIWAADIQFSKT